MEKRASGEVVRSMSGASSISEASVEPNKNGGKTMEVELNPPKRRLVKKMMYDYIKAAVLPHSSTHHGCPSKSS